MFKARLAGKNGFSRLLEVKFINQIKSLAMVLQW